jgi:predicted kinase
MPDRTLPDPACILLIGAAGSGKTTFAAQHFPADAILSSDALREAISGDAADQSVNRAAFRALHRALDRRLARGLTTVVDATNATAAARRSIREIAARHSIPTIAIVLDLPAAVVRARNAARAGRRVPDAVVSRHLEQVATTLARGDLAAEGYARIIHIHDPSELNASAASGWFRDL